MKKWLAWTLAMVLALSVLAGCSASGGNASGGNNSSSGAAADSKNTSEPAESKPADSVPAAESSKEEAAESSESSEDARSVPPEESFEEPTEVSFEEPEPVTDPSEVLAPAEDPMWNILQELLDKALDQHPEGTAQEIAEAIKAEKSCFLKFGAFDGEYYLPGLNWDTEIPAFTEKVYLIDQLAFSGAVMYVSTVPEGMDTDKAIADILCGLDPYWIFDEESAKPVAVTAKSGDKLAIFLYGPSFDIEKTYEGPMAGTPRELVQIFKDFRTENPEATALETAEYLFDHQMFTQAYTEKVEPGRLMGIGTYDAPVETAGFSDGAIMTPMIMPSAFLSYVFILQEGMAVSDFEAFLQEHADVAWNVCMSVNTIIIEAQDNAILFMMCNE